MKGREMNNIPDECVGYIGTSSTYQPGQWISTLDGTLYQVVAPSIEAGRRVYRYDTAVDIRTACTEEEWQRQRGHMSESEVQ